MVRSASMECIKYLLFAFNAIFVLCGIALIAVGAVVLSSLSPQKLIYAGFLGAPVAIIVLGVFVFILAFLGCCGAWKEHTCMITTFSVLLLVILICELGAAIAAYVYRSQIGESARKSATESINEFETNKDMQKFWNDAQSSLKCCGANNYTDYFEDKQHLPSSCCPDKPENCTVELAYKKGCLKAFIDLFNEKIIYVGATGIVICFIEIVGIIFGCCLAKSIKKNYEVV
ncbi:CD63 antigen-like [Ornithodoros turicata]|uniref:CD63 antigen-like n=1 Tax=Ornithodoros turicata TaxID=34597 RepID=UPI003139F72D